VLQFDAATWRLFSEKLPQGLTLDPQGGFEMVTATRKEIVRVDGKLFDIEVFHLSEDTFDQSRFSRRRKVDLGDGMTAWVATAEDVIVQKIRWLKNANRTKDYEDILNVLRRKMELLDFEYIQDWCGKHGTLEILAKARAEVGV
jgi:hypothetical protein|tara:strand:- start:5989 stop:6420 length:432 start_codon:yes stop_codon:yes gene_type:complete